MNRFHSASLSAVVALVPAGLAAGQEHSDVAPRVVSGQLVTGERVFGYDFQETVQDPYAISDPGFNAPAGSGLPAGSRLGVEPVALPPAAGGVTGLAYWDGVATTPGGDPAFGPAPQGETLTLGYLSQNRTFSSTGAVPGGFPFGPTVGDGGTFHAHLSSILNDGPGASPTPLDGVYLLGLRLTSDSPSVAASEPAYIVFNSGLPEAQHDVAIDFVSSSVVPEPASLALALPAAGLLLRRRRR